jgi:hypothetical protein
MYRERRSDNRDVGIDGRNSGGVHRQGQKDFHGEWP